MKREFDGTMNVDIRDSVPDGDPSTRPIPAKGSLNDEALYVQSAAGVAYEDGRLSLKGIAPTTLFVSEWPDRVTGHIPMEEFLASWGQGSNSFAHDPPNAVLSTLSEDDVAMVLEAPALDGTEMSYEVEILDGDMPASGGLSSLFIDVIGRPPPPVLAPGYAPGYAGGRASEGCSENRLGLVITKAGGAVILSVRAALPLLSRENWDHSASTKYAPADAYRSSAGRWPSSKRQSARGRLSIVKADNDSQGI